MDDLFRGISLSGHGLASIILTANPNLRLGPVFGGKVKHSAGLLGPFAMFEEVVYVSFRED